MKQLIKRTKIVALLILAISFIGCDDDDVKLPEVIAGFTHTISQETGTVTFINTSVNADNYSWDFGDATTSTEINPIKVYATGTYTIVLTTSNVAGASSTYEDTITINIPLDPTLPLNFNDPNVKYDEVNAFNGVAFAVVDNPDPSGSNTTISGVGQIINSGAQYEGFSFTLADVVDLTTDQTIILDFWSDIPVTILLKLENPNGSFTETTATHSGSGWEELIFTFDSMASYSIIVFFVDGPGMTTGTFYIDNIQQSTTIDVTAPVITLTGDATINLTEGDTFTDPGAEASDNTDGDITANITVAGDTVDTSTVGTYTITYNVSDAAGNAATEVIRTVIVAACTDTQLVFPINFDSTCIDYASKDSGDVAFEVIDNPELSGINSGATKVAKLVFDANQPWENMNLSLDTPISFATDKGVKMKVFSSSARVLKLKFETGGTPMENDQDHTGSGWEELTFTINSSDSFSNLVLFIDGGSNTVGTFYIDDIEQVSVSVTPTCTTTTLELPIDFDCDGIDYVSKDSGDVAFEVIDNPELSGINSGATKVAKLVFDSNQPWENMNLSLDTPISFATDKDVKMKVFSSSARVLKLKFETGGTPMENDQNHTGSGWEELTFTINSSDSFSNLILFVDGGSSTVGTFYIDDIEQVSGGGSNPGNLILDYENNLTGIGVDAFESGGALISNPVSGGINTSPNVYEITYTSANQWWGGVGFVVGSAALSETHTEYTAKLYSTVAPINVLFEVEQSGVGGTTIGNTQEITTANQWVEVTFTLQGGAGIDRVLVRPAVGAASGTKSDSGTLYVDDISSAVGAGGGGGGPIAGCASGTLVRSADFPVDFEGCETFMATDGSVKFGDAISAELAANPSASGINTSAFVLKVDKPAGANHWEGVQNAFAADFDSSLTFKVKIYSTLPNVDFRFEISNDPNDPSVGNPAGILKTVTTANVWTEVEVTFPGVPPGGHNNFVIKPNDIGGGTVPTSGIYYFDDVRLE